MQDETRTKQARRHKRLNEGSRLAFNPKSARRKYARKGLKTSDKLRKECSRSLVDVSVVQHDCLVTV